MLTKVVINGTTGNTETRRLSASEEADIRAEWTAEDAKYAQRTARIQKEDARKQALIELADERLART